MKPITDILREARNGRAVDQASLKLAEVVRAVDDTGKPGEVTITIKVKPEKGGGRQKTLDIQVKAKSPIPELPEAIFFSDEEGALHRQDPDQGEMFAEVEGGRRRRGGPAPVMDARFGDAGG